MVYGRPLGKIPRKSGEIGIHAVRAGDIIGEHMIIFAGLGERLELTHRAHSRSCFGEGALNAARFLIQHRNEGKLFTMEDVIRSSGST
jgi:4-hydroxy-tetrahydrodipicolinate reductase